MQSRDVRQRTGTFGFMTGQIRRKDGLTAMEPCVEKARCCGCMACVDACPHEAVAVRRDSEGFPYPKIRQELCTKCNRCQAVCPMPEKAFEAEYRRCFAVQAKDVGLRAAGSSGGVFPVLAEYVLEHGGVVYGAGFDTSMRVIHQKAASCAELSRLTQSKYVQSDTEGVFRSVQQELGLGKQVLFVGTPCQAEALRRFLPRNAPNLLLVDLICYGVPSPGVWERYAAYLEKKHHGRLTEFHFRDKQLCNNGRAVCYKIDGKEYFETLSENLFTSIYFSNYALRPSCHVCPFTTAVRGSDITIGDFWEVETRLPQMDDGMGTSSVILHSETGNRMWDLIQDRFRYVECCEEQVMQPRLLFPTPPSSKRRLFFALYQGFPFFMLAEGMRMWKKARRYFHYKKR